MSHEHYFRDVSGLDRIDVYRMLELFGVTCPVAQHVVKKAMAAGQRGHKSTRRDWQDIADSAARKLQMIDEDLRAIDRACGVEGGVQGLQDHPIGVRADGIEPAVIENAAFFNSNWQEIAEAARMVSEISADWPDESRRQDDAAEEEAFAIIKAQQAYTGPGGVMIHCPGCDPKTCGCRP